MRDRCSDVCVFDALDTDVQIVAWQGMYVYGRDISWEYAEQFAKGRVNFVMLRGVARVVCVSGWC